MNEPAHQNAPRLYPSYRYRDARAAIAWLIAAFGFEEHVVYADGDAIHHAELRFGPSILMLGSASDDALPRVTPPSELRVPGAGAIYVAVDDADAHHARALAAGAVIQTELHDTEYGSRDYSALDLEGNAWSFGTYRPHV